MYQALYRKWRPRSFDDVVGQPHVTETLKRQVETGRLSHAYLFTGTRGTGKTSCAKILARAVNCENPHKGSPCNVCPSCIGIENGSILDVLELDAASNNGVDHIRGLRDEAVFTPAAVKKRVYIVDEVHMLSTPAFNALLKILEEPPAHLMFILATTELHKVPATIRSRCQQFAFKRIFSREIAERLQTVAQREGIELSGESAELLARLADGSMRDALSLLDQCAQPGAPLGQEQVLSALGLAGNLETARLMEHIALRDAEGALGVFSALYSGGKDVGALIGEMAGLCRDLLIGKTAPRSGTALMTGGYDETAMRRLSEMLTVPRLTYILSQLQSTLADLPRSGNRRIDAELCLLRVCDETLDASSEALGARMTRLEQALESGAGAAAERPEPSKRPSEDTPPWEEDTSGEGSLAAPPAPARPAAEPETDARENRAALPPPGDSALWEGLVAALRGKVPAGAYSYLKNPVFVNGHYADGTLTLLTDTELTKKAVGRPAVLRTLEDMARERLGSPVRVLVQVGGPQEQKGDKHDSLNDLLAASRRFGNITIKE